MKTSKLNFALIAMLVAVLFGHTAFATPNNGGEENPRQIEATQKFAYNVYAFKNELKFKLAFKNATEDKIAVEVLDQAGNVIHKDVVKNQEALNRNYNMSKVGAGVYTVKIEMGDLKAESEVAVGVSANKVDETFQAYVSPVIKDDAVRVFYQNGSNVDIKMTDTEGSIVYAETTSDIGMYAKKYDVSSLEKGTYVLTLTSGERTIEKIYTIQ